MDMLLRRMRQVRLPLPKSRKVAVASYQMGRLSHAPAWLRLEKFLFGLLVRMKGLSACLPDKT
jgi:hypothetical protein